MNFKKNIRLLREGKLKSPQKIIENQSDLTVTRACELAMVPRSTYYAQLNMEPSDREIEDVQLSKQIVEIFENSRRTYGKRRIQAQLRVMGTCVSLERIARLMIKNGLIATNKAHLKRAPKLAAPETEVAQDLIQRDFNPSKPNEVWVTDISYISTTEGWLYLAVVLDLFSRRVVGWHVAEHQRSELVITALEAAIARRPNAQAVILHSDRGSQYRSQAYSNFVTNAGFKQSMGAAKTCFDNAACETFFGTYKNEDLYRRAKGAKKQTKHAIFNYIEGFYNSERLHSERLHSERLHSKLGYLSPVDYEKQQRAFV